MRMRMNARVMSESKGDWARERARATRCLGDGLRVGLCVTSSSECVELAWSDPVPWSEPAVELSVDWTGEWTDGIHEKACRAGKGKGRE